VKDGDNFMQGEQESNKVGKQCNSEEKIDQEIEEEIGTHGPSLSQTLRPV
jgi:hypothetical protein